MNNNKLDLFNGQVYTAIAQARLNPNYQGDTSIIPIDPSNTTQLDRDILQMQQNTLANINTQQNSQVSNALSADVAGANIFSTNTNGHSARQELVNGDGLDINLSMLNGNLGQNIGLASDQLNSSNLSLNIDSLNSSNNSALNQFSLGVTQLATDALQQQIAQNQASGNQNDLQLFQDIAGTNIVVAPFGAQVITPGQPQLNSQQTLNPFNITMPSNFSNKNLNQMIQNQLIHDNMLNSQVAQLANESHQDAQHRIDVIANIEEQKEKINDALNELVERVEQAVQNDEVQVETRKRALSVEKNVAEEILTEVHKMKGLVQEQNENVEQIIQQTEQPSVVSSIIQSPPIQFINTQNDFLAGRQNLPFAVNDLLLKPKEDLIQMILELQSELNQTKLVQSASPNSQVIKCCWEDCHLVCPTQTDLREHILNQHIPQSQSSYVCLWENCPRQKEPFNKRGRIVNHIATHTKEKPFECEVEGCGKSFSRKDSLMTHMNTHSGVKEFQCTAKGCNRSFYHQRSLKKHMNKHQEDDFNSNDST